jgi:hypothetical protein
MNTVKLETVKNGKLSGGFTTLTDSQTAKLKGGISGSSTFLDDCNCNRGCSGK